MRKRCAALSALFLAATLARAGAQSLEGTWIAVHDVNGVVYPHIEELRIAREGGVATRIHGMRVLTECEGKPPAQTGPCAVGQPSAAGQLAIDEAKGTIALVEPKFTEGAMAGIGVADDARLARELFWFGPGAPWTFKREPHALALSRRSFPRVSGTDLDGSKPVLIENRYYRADETLPGQLIVLADVGGLPLAKFACIMPFVTGETESARAFRTLLKDITAVFGKISEMLVTVGTDPQESKVAMLQKVVATLRGPDPAAADIADTAAALGVETAQVWRYIRELTARAQQQPADGLMFSMLKPHEGAIRACHKQYFE